MIARLIEMSAAPPGTCLVCHRPMDESKCRIGSAWTSEDLRASAGVERVINVYCSMLPAGSAMPTDVEMGNAIQNLRQALKLQVRTLADRARMSVRHLRRIESGEVTATTEEHHRLLKAFGFEVVRP